MELSVNALREEVDPFLAELGTVVYRHGAGLSSTLPLGALYRDHPALTHPETFSLVKEALERRSSDPEARRRLRALLEFVADHLEDAIAAEAVEEITALESTGQVAVLSGTQPFREAVAALPFEPSRHKRDLLEQAIGGFLFENTRPYARRRDAAPELARRLGFDGYEALRQFVTGIDARAIAGQCEEVLRRTEDAYRDVLGYALKKLDPELKPLPGGNARRHDLLRIATAPWLLEYFPRSELLPAVRRNVEEMGFHASATGRIQLDTDDRPGKRARAFVAAVRVPDDVRLVVRPGQGLDDAFCLLHEYGHALHLANVGRALPVEDRRLGDASVTEAWAYLFDHFLLDERWHQRFLRMSAPVAREAARIAAFNNLALLRRYCAKLPYELELYARGATREMAEVFEERQTAALFVATHRGFFLFDVDPQLYAVRYLRAWALEARLHRHMQETFDEDFWRNPAAGRWLRQMFERGQRDDAEQLSHELSGAPLDLNGAAERLVEVLNR